MSVFAESFEATYQVENEYVVGTAPTGDAPTTCEWSTILLPTKVRLILEVLRYVYLFFQVTSFYMLGVGVSPGYTAIPLSTPEVFMPEPICLEVILGCAGCRSKPQLDVQYIVEASKISTRLAIIQSYFFIVPCFSLIYSCKYSIGRSWGQVVDCPLWVYSLIYILCLSLTCKVLCCVVIDVVIRSCHCLCPHTVAWSHSLHIFFHDIRASPYLGVCGWT